VRDAQRNKTLEMSIEYPTRGGPHPVLIFSHGFGATSRAYVNLSPVWTSWGYVVIKPSHADAGRLQNLRNAVESWESQTAEEWRNRARDISLIVDSLQTLEQQYPELQGKLDHAKIGVGGHSYGAFTALLIAGATTSTGGAAPVSYADSRVKAVVAMSPQGVSASRGLTRESFANIRVPVLFMTGSEDRGREEGEDVAWRRQAFELSPPGDKWFVSIEGAGHFTFAGRIFDPTMLPPPARGSSRPRSEEEIRRERMERQRSTSPVDRMHNMTNVVRAATLAFWDAYLKDQTAGREYLERLKERTDVEFAVK
jgi:predicted dienelactone hydrolase